MQWQCYILCKHRQPPPRLNIHTDTILSSPLDPLSAAHLQQQDAAIRRQHLRAVLQDKRGVGIGESGQKVLHDQRVDARLRDGLREGLPNLPAGLPPSQNAAHAWHSDAGLHGNAHVNRPQHVRWRLSQSASHNAQL